MCTECWYWENDYVSAEDKKIADLQEKLEAAEAEKTHLKEHLLSLESSNAALQAQLTQAREENRSHLREIGAWRRSMNGVRGSGETCTGRSGFSGS